MDIKDIKFKAKRLDTGEWVKGDLVHSTSYIGICIYHPNNTFPDVPVIHKVDPDTVCMFTGLKTRKVMKYTNMILSLYLKVENFVK